MRHLQSFASFAVLIVIFVSACSTDSVTWSSVDDESRPQVSSPVERPFAGTCNVEAQFTSETTLRIVGTCQLSHLGRVSMSAIQTIEPGTLGIAYVNETVYTAADGDELRTRDAGVAVPNGGSLSLVGAVTIVDGTGRFANASGTAELAGGVHFTSPSTTIGSYSLTGKISY
jgi:hypothetical protein